MNGLAGLRDIIECIAQKATKKRYVEFPLLLEKWRELKDLVNVLRIPYEATVKMQRKDLTLSDTYAIWLEIRLRLNKIVNNRLSPTLLANALLKQFNKRYETIYKNSAMKAAIYLDPRYRMGIIQNRDDVRKAKEFILEMHRRLNHLKCAHGAEAEAGTGKNESNTADNFENFNVQDEMNQFWTNQMTESDSNLDAQHFDDFEAAVDAFDPPHININDSLIEYWHSANCNSELRDVAMAIFSISPCETQCERDFSQLKRIFSDLRANLLPETLENILTINLNKDIYLDVINKQVLKLRGKQNVQ